MNNISRKIGGHVSAAGGVAKAVERAHGIGANCVQVFSGSPRSWGRGPIENIDRAALEAVQEKLGITPIITHALYLINLASEKEELLQKSMEAITYDLHFDSYVRGGGVVVHLGSHLGRGWAACLDEVSQRLEKILAETPADSILMIENSAGQQGKLCSDLADVRELLDKVKSPRLQWCLDTCHAWAGGYSLGKEVTSEGKGTLEQAITQYNLWDALHCIHVNDSRDPFNSGKDRHSNLGEGTIPQEQLEYFLNLPQVQDLPLILEVPGADKNGPDVENVERLKRLVEKA